MSNISIVVPVYRVEPYIRRCVDSILAQDYRDFDLVLVDDGSPDGCPAICDEYAEKDERIHVIHQQNGGLSAARNAGIDWAMHHSDSCYIGFIDSDDWILPNYLSALLAAVEKAGVDISCCYSRMVSEKSDYAPWAETNREIVMSPEEFWIANRDVALIAWGKLYRKELFRGIRYPVGKKNEDEFITHRLLFSCPKIVIIEMALYCYFFSQNSITRSPSYSRSLDGIQAVQEQILFFKENGFRVACRRSEIHLYWMYRLKKRQLKKHDDSKRLNKELDKLFDEFAKKRSACCLYRLPYGGRILVFRLKTVNDTERLKKWVRRAVKAKR